MLSFDLLKSTIALFETNRVRYYIFGGVALDGLRGALSREHKDLDTYVRDDDAERFSQLMEAKGFRCRREKTIYVFERGPDSIGAIALSPMTERYMWQGTTSLKAPPGQDFEPEPRDFPPEPRGNIKGLRFSIVPNEVLALQSQYSRFPEDKKFGAELPYNRSSYGQIRYGLIWDSLPKRNAERKPQAPPLAQLGFQMRT